MALDGIVISNIVAELNSTILNSKISKIAEPEADELLLTLKGSNGSFRLSMSASASLPFIYLTPTNKVSPLTAPTFCMVLRKHIANGRITKIYQPGMERIINFEIEHLNEMGDLCHKVLIIETTFDVTGLSAGKNYYFTIVAYAGDVDNPGEQCVM